MTAEYFKLLAPIAILIILLIINRGKGVLALTSTLFFSVYILASNFQFVYRELHAIVLILVLTYVIYTVHINRYVIGYDKNIRLMFLFMIAILISSVKSTNLNLYISVLVNYLVIFGVILFISIRLKNITSIDYLLLYISDIVVITSVLMILYSLVSSDIRHEGVSSNSNYIAYMLATGFIFLLFSKKEAYVRYIQGGLIFYAVNLTHSRSILVALLFSLFLYYLYRSRSKVLTIVIFVMVIVSVYLFVGLDGGRFDNIEEDASSLQRVQLWIISYNIFIENYLMGIGYGQFIIEFKNYFSPEMYDLNFSLVDMEMLVTHNDYLRVVTELGVVGLMVFLYLHVAQWRSLLNIKRIYSKRHGFMLMAIFFLNVSFSLVHNNINSAIFWILLSLPLLMEKAYVFDSEHSTTGLRR
jgi:O-antigen ligase